MASIYRQEVDGEWIQPVMEGYRLACCDCGLIHVIDFRIVKGKIEFRAFRDQRATGQRRRHKRLKVVQEFDTGAQYERTKKY